MNKLILIFIIISFQLLFALEKAEYSAVGTISDSNTGEAIAGATIKVVDENKGTYSSTRGKFKIPFLRGDKNLKVSSLGYETQFVKVNSSDSLIIKLKTLPIKLKEAKVFGNIEANEVIKRAILRKDDNQKLLKTFKGLLYSKLVMELDGSALANSDGNSFSLGVSLGGEKTPEQNKMFVLESFSRDYKDFEKNISHSEIIQRRQTTNMKPNDNVMALGNFFNFYQDEINFINASFTTPLSKDALSSYKFEILDKDIMDDKFIYIIKVIPDTKLFPVFEGTIKILEGTYNLVELDLKPSDEAAIAFIDNIHIVQKFEEIKKDIWHPVMLEVTAKVNVEVLKGFMDIALDAKASSIFSETEVNVPLPDSIYENKLKRITVSPLADSNDLEYWEKNSLRDITQKERDIYIKIDSLVAISDTNKQEYSSFNSDWLTPFLDFNRVSSLSLGLSPSLSYDNLRFNTSGAYSFGLKKFIGELELSNVFSFWEKNYLTLKSGIFSKVPEIGNDNSFHRLINTAIASLFHYDYYDYYKSDGWFVSLKFTNKYLEFNSTFENSRQFTLEKTTDKSIFSNFNWRENPNIMEGNYNTLKNSVALNLSQVFPLYEGLSVNIGVNYLFGNEKGSMLNFQQYSANMEIHSPTFETGYNPMSLSLMLEYSGSKDAPIQYASKVKTNMNFISKFGNFCTVPLSTYEKNEFWAVHIKYNFTDIWWRALQLPLYYGRGLDLVGRFSTGKFNTAFVSDEFYSEIGFGFERIPTFVSNVIYFGGGAVWGVGPIAKGNFNWYLDITLPF